MPIRSAHGSSIKRALSTGKPFREILEEDSETLERYDRSKLWTVNYDTFAGHLPGLSWSDSFSETRICNLQGLTQALKIASASDLGFALLEAIISDVASIFRASGRKICFEMPGTRGWSMYPDLGAGTIRQIINLLETYLPEATLCIDVGHVLTWTKRKERLLRFVRDLGPYWRYIRMIHVSSAGSWTKYFVDLHRHIHGENMPLWHIKGLDLQLPICEPEQCFMLQTMRDHYADVVLEVSETRLPSHAIADYFKGHVDFTAIDDSTYHQDLIDQGRILGYR
jgi:hypothetical protein